MKPIIALLVLRLVAGEVVADDPVPPKSIPTPSKDASAPTRQGVIVAASDASNAAQRLKTLIAQNAGLNFAVVSPDQKHDAGELQFVFCTTASRCPHALTRRTTWPRF